MSTLDPMDAAVQDAESANQYFGKLECDAQYVLLRKGQRKTVWTEGMDEDGKTTEVSLRLNPSDFTGMTRMVERQVISNSGEWSRIVWPSLRDLGCKSLRDANGKFAHVQMVESGREWTNNTGQLVKGTTFRFVGLYNTEAELTEAYEKLHGSQPQTQRQTGSAPGVEAAPANDAEKAVAAQFLPSLVKMANGDLQALAQNLATMQPVCKYFTIDSPEVQALLKAA